MSLCPTCHKYQVSCDVKDYKEGKPTEISYVCPKCGQVGLWSHGKFSPNFPFNASTK